MDESYCPSDSSDLSDLFGDDSQDEYVLPTTSEDESINERPKFSWQPRKRKKHGNKNRRVNKKLFFATSTSLAESRTTTKTASCSSVPPRDTTSFAKEPFHQDPANQEPAQQDPAHEDPANQNPTNQNTPKKRTRKKTSCPASWKTNLRKEAHQAGKSYKSRRGKIVQQKQIKTFKNCGVACKLKCQQQISSDERLDVHLSYNSLPSATEKRHFLLNNTERSLTARPGRKCLISIPNSSSSDSADEPISTSNKSRRQYSFRYFFTINGDRIQVCKPYFLGTLSISQKPVYTAHKTKIVSTNTATQDKRGCSENSRRKPQGDPEYARKHIESFPKVEAHYCRANTTRNYLGSHLSVQKMHSLYLQKCAEDNIAPVKLSMYWKIFNTEYNLGFHIPKSDRCDFCEKFTVAQKSQTLTDIIQKEFELHVVQKNLMRDVRSKEKVSNVPALVFDLQNVILTPHADIGSLLYLRKLRIYNLTAYYTPTKRVYCALWSECIGGRAGNEIASAFKKILDVLADENEIIDLVTWSDSCVPQNRNSFISNAVLDFLRDNNNVSSVTMKYSLPGHSCVQEVDNVHSQIEKAFRKCDFFSPIGLVRLLKQINVNNPFRIIQMKPDDFKDYGNVAKHLNYKLVPYTQLASIKFTRSFSTVSFKTSHDPYEPENSKNIRVSESPQRKCRSNSTQKTKIVGLT